QSTNVMKQRQAVQPPAATANRNAATPANANAARNSAAQQPKSGFSRFLGPIAGIAAGLGIAALLSSLGLGGALLEFLSSAILIGLVIFAVMFLVRRLRGGAARPAAQGANHGGYGNNSMRESQPSSVRPEWPATGGAASAQPVAEPVAASEPVASEPVDKSW